MKERQSRTDLEPVRWIGSPEVYGASFFVLRSSFLFRRRRSDDQLERDHSAYHAPEDWVFASGTARSAPYGRQAILPKYLRPEARNLGTETRSGWWTFRHNYSKLLRSVGTEFKEMQELVGRPPSQLWTSTRKQLHLLNRTHRPQRCPWSSSG